MFTEFTFDKFSVLFWSVIKQCQFLLSYWHLNQILLPINYKSVLILLHLIVDSSIEIVRFSLIGIGLLPIIETLFPFKIIIWFLSKLLSLWSLSLSLGMSCLLSLLNLLLSLVVWSFSSSEIILSELFL